MMRRREFMLLGGAAIAWPLAARAQQPGKQWRIGMLETISAAANAASFNALRKGLRDLGYVEGNNLIIEYRSADGASGHFPELAAELVRQNVDLIVTRGTPAVLAAKAATVTIPVVMAAIGEPMLAVASIARPKRHLRKFVVPSPSKSCDGPEPLVRAAQLTVIPAGDLLRG